MKFHYSIAFETELYNHVEGVITHIYFDVNEIVITTTEKAYRFKYKDIINDLTN